ncbi:MAG: hypothetical protein AAF551_06380, partial [Bacteroidota bacterium]
EQIHDAPITSSSELYGNGSSEVEDDVLWKLKLGVPVIMKKDKLFAVQVKSYRHEFFFDTEDVQANFTLFDEIDQRVVTSSGARLIYQQDAFKRGKISFVGGMDVKSDHFSFSQNSMQYYAGSTYTVKKDSKTRIGGGLIIGADLGVFSFSPVLIYERNFAPNWTLDLQLPKYMAVRHRLKEGSFLIGKIEGKAWRYNLTDLLSEEQSQLTLRKVDVQVSIDYEQEIHDWLWFGVSAGYNKNLSYYLSNPGDRSRDALFQLNPRSAPTLKASLFVVPPRKFFR